MKRYFVWFLMAAAVVLATACSKGENPEDYDIIGGQSANSNQMGRKYMMSMVDDLFAVMLEELELALDVEERQLGQSAHFEVVGSLGTPGSVWTVKAKDSQLQGMTISCSQYEQWTLTYDGDFALVSDENLYPTKVTLVASRINREILMSDKLATGWSFTVQGQRTEREDYSCTFTSNLPGYSGKKGLLEFANTRGAGAQGWDKVYGDLTMSVFKKGEPVDICCLSFEGSPSQATFLRGL